MEISNFVHNGARRVTPAQAEAFRQKLPILKLKLADTEANHFPHLHNQVGMLIDLFEDVLDNDFPDLPFVTFAEVVFALEYLAKPADIIPDSIPGFGMADDSAIVRAVLLRNEPEITIYTAAKGISWSKITTAA